MQELPAIPARMITVQLGTACNGVAFMDACPDSTPLLSRFCTVQKALARTAERVAAGSFVYNKFFAIGLFRLLEVSKHTQR
jgi:hypothetical protein